MSRLILYIKPKFDEYEVKACIYDSAGKLVEEKAFFGIKQIVIKGLEVRLSRQLFHEYITLIVDAPAPKVEVKEGGLLYIFG